MPIYAGRYDEPLLKYVNGRLTVATGAEVTVYESDGTTLATLYTDRTKDTQADNPISPDAAGNLEFFADPGQYVLAISENDTLQATNTIVVPHDTDDVGAGGGEGGGATNLGWNAETSTVTSDTGTDATLTTVDASNPGLMAVAQKTKLDGIAAGAEVNAVDSVNGATGAVALDADDIDDSETVNKFVTAAQAARINLPRRIYETATGTWTGDAPTGRADYQDTIEFVSVTDPTDATNGITTPDNIVAGDRWKDYYADPAAGEWVTVGTTTRTAFGGTVVTTPDVDPAWDGSFVGGEILGSDGSAVGWRVEQESSSDRITLVTDVDGTGAALGGFTHAARILTGPADLNVAGASGDGGRTELRAWSSDTGAVVGTRSWYRWFLRLDGSFQFPGTGDWAIITQFHGGTGSPVISFEFDGSGDPDSLLMRTRGGDSASPTSSVNTVIPNMARDQTYQFDLEVFWSEGSAGETIATIDGTTVATVTGKPNKYTGSTVYLKQGVYRSSITDYGEGVVWVGGTRRYSADPGA